MPTKKIWIVDDDRGIRFVLERALSAAGFAVRSYSDAESALEALARDERPHALFTDLRMPGQDGHQLLAALQREHPELPVVVMSAYTDLQATVGAFSGGAFDYLPKPFDIDQAVDVAERATAGGGGGDSSSAVADGLVGSTPAMQEVFRTIGRLSRTELGVLITGETGTGKELIAQALHLHSPRAKGSFVALNTAAIAPELLESELFGHEQGAFTGATRRHAGRFEQADGGTLFLDEIGDMPLSLQTRLLRVLAEGEYYRVGGRELLRSDVRVLAATHQDLRGKVERGEFRADLLHRLDVVRIHLPPLRERMADLPALANRFLLDAARSLGIKPKRIAEEALQAFASHRWPGNVRELRNLCTRLAAMAPGNEILAADVRHALASSEPAPATALNWLDALNQWAGGQLDQGRPDLLSSAREQLELSLIELALQRTQGDRQQAARLLGCGRNTLTRKLGPKP
ncbi:MAG: nitrogen regulation protein NR(I) [Xanthomonadales bacterium]|nr:nitrogen regulation protein NR(I) [Xanthomonadales bacterium]